MSSRGSEWHRWEPHIHAPGTLLNNQFKATDWDAYLTAIECATPPIRAIAITDYYTTTLYEEVCSYKNAGRLSNVELIFPNIELRLDIAGKSGFINIHLLVNPSDPNHVVEMNRFLSRLRFSARDDTFDCTPQDLIRLGRVTDGSLVDDRAAMAHGATQFKVNFEALKTAYKTNAWAKSNIIIGVAGASGDGTSGLRQGADQTIRQEIEKFSDFIFTSNPTQREFWLGLKTIDLDVFLSIYGGLKPCMHGSDAHNLQTVGNPSESRYSWIKGALTFDSLRQACIDPASRASVGEAPPMSALPSQVVSHVDITDAEWMRTNKISLNSGLIAIIGARGSGKTALADMIAAGCDSFPEDENSSDDVSASFLSRAKSLLGDGKIKLTWAGGGETVCWLDGRDNKASWSFQRARYLSQQFVENLCSAKGASQGLVKEIERVIFEAHQSIGATDAIDFEQLREHQTGRHRQARTREAEAISALSESVGMELEKEGSVPHLKALVTSKEGILKGYQADLQKLVVKGSEAYAQRHTEITAAIQAINSRVSVFAAQKRVFLLLQDEVANTYASKSPEILRQTIAQHPNSGLSPDQWNEFLLIYKGDVKISLANYVQWADGEVSKLVGPPVTSLPSNGSTFIGPELSLAECTLSLLKAESTRLEQLIGADAIIRRQYNALVQKINVEAAALKAAAEQLADAEGAVARRRELQHQREDAYGRLFTAIESEQQTLSLLYSPLAKRLESAAGTLKKLSIKVSRICDIEQWAAYGEDHLIDCRKSGSFMGRGTLLSIAKRYLGDVWLNASAVEVKLAMNTFIKDYSIALLAHAPSATVDRVAFKQWSSDFAKWLFSTDHISVRYEILYGGADIRKLSPGTRGIVLLLLYLALDEGDNRPLIIDQPEENLDPKSVNDELVPLFMAARQKRQVIIVTHNANLVVNTDADQIIIANSTQVDGSELPHFSYISGGLENDIIRKSVCDILEGGDRAFKERARRLRVGLGR